MQSKYGKLHPYLLDLIVTAVGTIYALISFESKATALFWIFEKKTRTLLCSQVVIAGQHSHGTS